MATAKAETPETAPAPLTTASLHGSTPAPEPAAEATPEPQPTPEPEPEPVPQSVKDAIKATRAAAKSGHPVEVVESFTTLVKGAEVHYRKGELVHPDDPVLSRSPELFRPLVYPHGRRGTLSTPEIRS
jgi:hypothetical protein